MSTGGRGSGGPRGGGQNMFCPTGPEYVLPVTVISNRGFKSKPGFSFCLISEPCCSHLAAR